MLGRGITLFVALSLLAAGCGSSDNGRSESAGQSGALEFVANPSTVTVGANTWLSWSGRDATSCQASGGWTGERPASGGFRTPPLTQTTTYTLNCTGPGRGSRARVKVVVSGATGTADGAPQVSLRSQAGSIPSNGSTVLEWTAPTAGQCTASGGWSGKKPNRGSQRITGLTADSTFTLSCDGPGGTGIAMTQVMLQRATLRWAGSNVDNLAAFRILWGKSADQPEHQITVSDPNARERAIDLPGSGTYYFILATLDASSKELGRSNTASKLLPP